MPEAQLTTDERIAARESRLELASELAALVEGSAVLSTWITACAESLNGSPGRSESFDDLDSLILRQPWRLAYWRVAADEVNCTRTARCALGNSGSVGRRHRSLACAQTPPGPLDGVSG